MRAAFLSPTSPRLSQSTNDACKSTLHVGMGTRPRKHYCLDRIAQQGAVNTSIMHIATECEGGINGCTFALYTHRERP